MHTKSKLNENRCEELSKVTFGTWIGEGKHIPTRVFLIPHSVRHGIKSWRRRPRFQLARLLRRNGRIRSDRSVLLGKDALWFASRDVYGLARFKSELVYSSFTSSCLRSELRFRESFSFFSFQISYLSLVSLAGVAELQHSA